MSMFGARNPVLNDRAFEPSVWDQLDGRSRPAARNVMTVRGAASVTLLLVGVVTTVALAVWIFGQANLGVTLPAAIIGSLVGLVLCWTACFKPQWSPFIAIPFAVCEGLTVGALSVFWTMYASGNTVKIKGMAATLSGGLVMQAVLLTIAIAAGVLLLNMANILRATERFMAVLFAATIGLLIYGLAAFLLNLCGIQVPYFWSGGLIGIGFSAFVVVLASMWLVWDFDFIRSGAANGAPKYMEWYAGIGLLVTLVWLYTSILRLLAMLNRRN